MSDQIPSGSVIVTPTDMWKAVQETRDIAKSTEAAITELKSLMHPALADVRADVQTLDEREQKHHDAHESAIKELQKQSWSSRWVTALVTAVLTATAGGLVLYALSHGAIN